MRNLALIPARSGSKGLPDKNIRMLGGMPLIAHSIQAARESGLFSEIVVSTDSREYAEIAEQWGAAVPFIRGAALSSDNASSWDVAMDTITKFAARGVEFDTLTLLQPTSPLRTALDIAEGYRELSSKEADAVVAVCEVDHSPLWCNTLPPDHSLNGFLDPVLVATPRQSLPTFYRINGAMYVVRVPFLLANSDLYGPTSYAVVMPRSRSIDIDDETDLLIAEALLTQRTTRGEPRAQALKQGHRSLESQAADVE